MFSGYLIHILILIGIYLILAISFQISFGYTGLFNFGHIAFYAIGAYVSALLSLNGMPFLFSFILAGIIAMLFGFLISMLTNKLKGDYLALATFGFSFVIYTITLNWISLTNGPLGLSGITRPSFFGFILNNNFSFLILVIIIVLLSLLIIKKIISSPFGKVLEAIRDDELAVKVLGKNTFKMKTISFGISAFFAGLAGSLYAYYISFIDPFSFAPMQLIPILAIVIIGGIASFKGTIIATIVLVVLPELLSFIGFHFLSVGPIRQILYALILLLILIFRPKGFYGKIKLK